MIEQFWPLNFAELCGHAQGEPPPIKPEDIADYTFPPGARARYKTEAAYQRILKYMRPLDVQDFGAVPDDDAALSAGHE